MPVLTHLISAPDTTFASDSLIIFYYFFSCSLFLVFLALLVFCCWVNTLYARVSEGKETRAIRITHNENEKETAKHHERKHDSDVQSHCADTTSSSNNFQTPDESDTDSETPSLVRDDSSTDDEDSSLVRDEVNPTIDDETARLQWWIDMTFGPADGWLGW